MKAYLHFTNKLDFIGRSAVKCKVRNILTGETFWLSFSNNHQMYRRICNIRAKVRKVDVGEFKAYVSYFNESKNRVKIIKGKELREFVNLHPEYFV